MTTWNPTEPNDWTRAFGLVAVPYFGRRPVQPAGQHYMMQDGKAASFALHIDAQDEWSASDSPLGWAWSSHVTHAVVLQPETGRALVRRWDDPSHRQDRVLSSADEAARFIRDLENSPAPPRAEAVIARTLATFSLLRTALEEERGGTALDVIIAFNAALLIAEEGRDEPDSILPESLADAVRRFYESGRSGFDGRPVSATVQPYPIADFARIILEERRDTSPYMLDADLLIRHASGSLYQEARRRLTSALPPPVARPTLFGDDPLPAVQAGQRDRADKDVHYTPP